MNRGRQDGVGARAIAGSCQSWLPQGHAPWRAASLSDAPLTFGVVGYSTRALVQAVTDLGHRAIAIDAFRDQDTLNAAEQVILVENWPGDILDAVQTVAVDAWLLAGGIENQPSIVDQLSQRAPILGPTPAQLQALRSAEFWASLCEDGIHWPTTTDVRPHLNLNEWLLKPAHGSGGLGIRRADSQLEASQHASCYWQRHIQGRVLGASWVMHNEGCRWLGITQSLGHNDWPGPTEFIYRGSIGPIGLPAEQVEALLRLGQRVLAALPGYRGYLQADLVEDSEGRLWLLEFNPRWTAGMEILQETATSPDCSPLGEHLRAWGISSADGVSWNKPPTKLVAKAIYYAAADIELNRAARAGLQNLLNWQTSSTAGIQWCVADLPEVTEPAPMRFEEGRPILTLKCRLVGARASP